MTQLITPPPPRQQPPGGNPPMYWPVPPTNTMAILSLVFAFLFWPLAIVFGHIASKEIALTGERGSGLAIAGLVIGYVGLGLMAFLLLIIGLSIRW